MQSIHSNYHSVRFISAVGILILMNLPAGAQDNERELFNQLYREIMSSATDAGAIRMDSLHPEVIGTLKEKSADQSENSKSDDAAAEQLQEEINKMVKDIQARHSEKIRFMQDGKRK